MGQACGPVGGCLAYEKIGGSSEQLSATVVQVNSASPSFPAAHSNITRALCASGGGSRAMTYTMGIFRGLNELGLLSKLDAISSVSGGAWFASIFMFGKTYNGSEISTGEMLGGATGASKLSMSVLKEDPAPLGAVITRHSTLIAAEQAVTHKPQELWQRTIAQWLLEPFGLNSLESFLAASESDKTRIVADNPVLADKTFLTPRPDRPETLVINGTWNAPVGYYAGADSAVSLQVSPDWTGSPFYPDDKKVLYPCAYGYMCTPSSCRCLCSCCGTRLIVGGGFVETFAFGGAAPATKEQMGGKAAVGYPVDKPMSLAAAIGISSFDLGGKLEAAEPLGEIASPQAVAWPVLDQSIQPGPQSALRYEYGDGGELDNSGLCAMLQRGARKVVWIASAYLELSTTYDYAGATAATFDPDAANVVPQLQNVFGYKTNSLGYHHTHNQVFSKDRLLDVVRTLVALRDEGSPAVCRFTCEVMSNTWWGISGGFEVDVLLIFLQSASKFEASLPDDTKAELAKKEDGAFANFPIYSTLGQNGVSPNYLGLTACQVNLLAAQGEHSVTLNTDLFRDFFS